MSDHLLHHLTMIGVFVPGAKRPNPNQSAPVYLRRLKVLLFTLGWFDPVMVFDILIVQHDSIDTQVEQPQLLYLQPPNKLGLQPLSKAVEKLFGPVRRSDLLHIGFHTSGMAWMSFKRVEIGNETTSTIRHKAQDPFEKLEHLQTLNSFSDKTNKSVDQQKNPDLMQIRRKKRQPNFTAQVIAGQFNCADFQFLFLVISAISAGREVLYAFGLTSWLNSSVLLIFIPEF